MDLLQARQEIDQIDQEMKRLYLKRMQVVAKIAQYKKENDMPIFDAQREASLIARLTEDVSEPMQAHYREFIECMLKTSKDYQKELLYGKE